MKSRFNVALDLQCEPQDCVEYMDMSKNLQRILEQLLESPTVYTNAESVDADYLIWMDTTLRAKVLIDVEGESEKLVVEKLPFLDALKMDFPNATCVKRKAKAHVDGCVDE